MIVFENSIIGSHKFHSKLKYINHVHHQFRRSGYYPWVRTGLYPSTGNTRNMKKETSLTPFRSALQIFIFEFNDSAEALVSLLMK